MCCFLLMDCIYLLLWSFLSLCWLFLVCPCGLLSEYLFGFTIYTLSAAPHEESSFFKLWRFKMSQELRQLDILIGSTQYQIRKAQEVFDSVALSCLQTQYRDLISQRMTLLHLQYEVKEFDHA